MWAPIACGSGPQMRACAARRLLWAVALTGVSLAHGAFAATPLTTERVASGLQNPLFVTAPSGDFDRLFVVEQPGRIRILDLGSDPPLLEATPFLDITDRGVSAGQEQGLLGLAFHPDFGQNRLFYVNYTDSGGATRISRFQVPIGGWAIIICTFSHQLTSHGFGIGCVTGAQGAAIDYDFEKTSRSFIGSCNIPPTRSNIFS